MFQVTFGAHFTLRSLSESHTTKFDEFKISQALDSQLVENGGNVASYSLLTSKVELQMKAQGQETVSEYVLGIGLNPDKNRIRNIHYQGIQPTSIETLMRDEVWFPGEILHQPFGKGTKRYDFDTVDEMIFDMEDYSDYSVPFDPISVLSQSVNSDMQIDGQIINMIVPAAFKGEIIQNIGEYFSYCVTTPSYKRYGNLRYAPNSCQVKYKARAIASFNKIPGFPKVSGYKGSLAVSAGLISTEKQQAHIIDRMTSTFPEFARQREQVLAEAPQSNYGLIKESVFVRLRDGVTKNERLQVQNLMLANIEESQFMFWDMLQQFDDMDERNTLVRFLHTLTSLVCLILGAF